MLVTRGLAPGLDLLDLHRAAPARYPLLLESSAAGTVQGRWDLLLAANGDGFLVVVDAEPHDLASADPERLWTQVLRRQPPPLAVVATVGSPVVGNGAAPAHDAAPERTKR